MKKHLVMGWAVLASLSAGALQLANAEEPNNGTPTQRRPHGPPAEAIQACSGIQDGASCSFTHDGRQVSGTCRAGPEGKPSACAPAGGPGGHGPGFGPPPEALEACKGLQEGATCSVSLRDGNVVSGECRAGPRGEAVACMPARPPEPI